jgi:hypothetical protein
MRKALSLVFVVPLMIAFVVLGVIANLLKA